MPSVRSSEMLRLVIICCSNGIEFLNRSNSLIKLLRDPSPNIPLIIEVVKLGADLNITSEFGNTPLYYAVDTRNEELVNAMLMSGADPYAKNKNGVSPIRHAQNMPKLKVMYNLMANHQDIKEPEFI